MELDRNKDQKYVLGVLGTESYNLETKKHEHLIKMEVSQDVYDWLEMHDIEYETERERIFVCNKVKYLDLGPKIESNGK